jgi:4-carboxymuconolactone decarboxylase
MIIDSFLHFFSKISLNHLLCAFIVIKENVRNCLKSLHFSPSTINHSLINAIRIISAKMATDPKFDTFHKELFEEGLKMRRSVVGDEYVNRALANGNTEFSRPAQEFVTEWCWGTWTRPGLDKKQRSLMNIGILMALNRTPELAVHIRGARNNGLTELEIREAILHATTYLGVPAMVEAIKTAEKVLDEMAEKGEKPRELGNKVSTA